MPASPATSQSRSDFFRKLSYYIAGLAIGFALLGIFQKLRQREAAQRAQSKQQQNTPQQSKIFPPMPESPATNK